MKEQLLRCIRNAIPVGFALLAFTLPLFFGTWSTEFFDFNKSILFIAATAILFTLWLLRLTLEGRIRFRKTILDIPLLILLLVLFSSSFFSMNRLLSFTRIEFWLWVCAIVLYFTYTNNRDSDFPADVAVIRALKMSGAILAVITFGKLLGLDLPNYSFDNPSTDSTGSPRAGSGQAFTPIGNVVILDLFLITLLIFELSNIKKFFSGIDERLATDGNRLPESEGTRRADSGSLIPQKEGIRGQFYSFLYLLLLILTVVTVNPLTQKLTDQGLSTSWQIASEIVKEKPLLGVGPGLYSEAFAIYKPFSFNNDANWNTVFQNASSVIFHLLTLVGLSGLLSLLLIFAVTIVNAVKKIGQGEEVLPLAALFLILSSAVAYWNPVILFLFFLILALNNKTSDEAYLTILEKRAATAEGDPSSASSDSDAVGWDEPLAGPASNLRNLLPSIFTLPLIAATLIGLWGVQKIFAAELTYKKANNLLSSGAPLIPTYSSFVKAAAYNPLDPRYRIAFSTISLSSAQTIIENATARNERMTAADQDFIRNLITQARREADAAVTLDPDSFTTFENRANFYKRISNLAPDAYDLSVADYKSAILKNLTSPILRARLGVIQRDVKKDYEAAKATLLEAVSLKPNYPEARLELARTYAFLEKKDSALTEYGEAEKAAADRADLAEAIRKEKADYENRGIIAIREILYSKEENERSQASDIVKSVEDINPKDAGPEEKVNVDLNKSQAESSPSALVSPTPTATATPSPTPQPTATPTPTPVPTATSTPTPTATSTPTPTATSVPTSTPTGTPTPTP